MKRLKFALIIGAMGLAATYGGLAKAASVPYPYIDIVQQPTDSGVTTVGNAGNTISVTMQGTALSINHGPGDVSSIDATFTLTATYNAALTAADGRPSTFDFSNGMISIAGSDGTNLTATFSDLVMQSSGTS